MVKSENSIEFAEMWCLEQLALVYCILLPAWPSIQAREWDKVRILSLVSLVSLVSYHTLPETNSSHLHMDGWNTILSFWDFGLFSGSFWLVLGSTLDHQFGATSVSPWRQGYNKSTSVKAKTVTLPGGGGAFGIRGVPQQKRNSYGNCLIKRGSKIESMYWLIMAPY